MPIDPSVLIGTGLVLGILALTGWLASPRGKDKR